MLRRFWRTLYWFPREACYVPAFLRAQRAFYFPAGFGDELLCTIPMREYARRSAGRSVMFTRRPELFAGNPDVAATFSPDAPGIFPAWRRWGAALHEPYYCRPDPQDADRELPPDVPLAAQMCLLAGLEGEVELRPWLHLDQTERDGAAKFAGAIAIQTSVSGARFRYLNKEWSHARWRELARRLARRHRIVQVGMESDPALGVGEDLRGRTSVRELAAVLSRCRLLVGLVGFCMHLALATETPAVIIFGGRERPDQSGYPCNENLYTAEPCAPCWRKNGCDFEKRCLERITVDDVENAVSRLLARPRGPLTTEHYAVDPTMVITRPPSLVP